MVETGVFLLALAQQLYCVNIREHEVSREKFERRIQTGLSVNLSSCTRLD